MADPAGHDDADVREVPVTIQGAKHVEGSEQRQIFTETTKTTIVFGNGAVVNLSSKVSQGQCVFLRNEQTGREILCKVLEWRQVADSGYVDLEFTTRDAHFWDALAAAPLAAPVVVPAPPVAVVASRSFEALDMLPASAPAPTAAQVIEAGAGARPSEANAAASAQSGATGAGETPAHHTAADVEADGETEAADGLKATLIAKLTPLGHKLHRLTYGKGAMGVGITASVLIVVALGFAWHSHHAATLRKNRAAAAVAQANQKAMAQSTAAAGSSGAELEAPAHGNNSGATPAQAAQKIQQQTGAPSAGVVVANNASASSAAVPPSAVPAPAPKLEARETSNGADQETGEQSKPHYARGPNGGETIPARIVSQSPAAIPPWAKGLDTDGVVQIDALIDEKGNVRSTKPLSGPRLLQHAAERAVALWIFEPALTDGKPTATHMVLTVEFQR